MYEYKIKVITGFREDQYVIIDGSEAHKVQYLFLHPEERAIFKNGVGLVGKNIQEIKPAWNETMGWNPSHKLDDDDWADIRNRGVDRKIQLLLSKAKEVAYLAEGNPELLSLPLEEAILPELEKPQDYKLLSEIKNLSDSKKV